ncbi:MAG: flagellar hook-basal body complex protein FliE [Actinomycetota bacterium]
MDVGGISGAGIGGVRPPRPPRAEGVGDGIAGAAGANGAAAGSGQAAAGFGEMLNDGIEAVASSERNADALAQRFAVGDPNVDIQDVTVATTEAGLSVQLMVAVRDRALDAYQQIINLQV